MLQKPASEKIAALLSMHTAEMGDVNNFCVLWQQQSGCCVHLIPHQWRLALLACDSSYAAHTLLLLHVNM